MTDSDPRQKPTPQQPPKPEDVRRIARTLVADLEIGDLNHSRTLLRMAPPETGRAALVALGAPYAEQLKKSPHVKLDNLRGPAAAQAFIRDELRPLAVREARKPLAQANTDKNSFMRRLARGTARAALLLAIAVPMTINETAPAISSDAIVASPAVAAIPTPASSASIQPLRDEFSKTALGRDMLAMASYHNISIVYDDKLSGSDTAGTYSFGDKTVRMSPSQDMPSQIMFLAHELRHAWQDIALEYADMERRLLTPNQQWTLRRYLEADAYAFSAFFMADRMKELPDAAVPGGQREMAAAKLIHAEFSSDDGLTNEEYRKHALDRMFDVLNGYNDNHLTLAKYSADELRNFATDILQHVTNDNLDDAGLALDNMKTRMNSTPSTQEFDDYLRRFGGTSLSPEAQTALQSAPAVPALLNERAHRHDHIAAQKETPLPNASNSAYEARLNVAESVYQSYRSMADDLTRIHRDRVAIVARQEAERLEREKREQAAAPNIQSRFTAPKQTDTTDTAAPQQPRKPAAPQMPRL